MENNEEEKINNIEDTNSYNNYNNKKTSTWKKVLLIAVIVIVQIIVLFTMYVILIESTSSSTVDKPIIYLYPEEETDVLVKLGNNENLTCSYPVYKDTGWKVKAMPNGDLTDLETGKNLYSLYYESKNATEFKVEKNGFVVKNTDTIQFLEEKLAILGLTQKEAEEFIIYWLPILQKNEYNYIRFASMEEINKNMPLDIEPTPDTIIRVVMTYKGLDKPIKVEEQKLETPIRQGFVAVEWGGTEIK